MAPLSLTEMTVRLSGRLTEDQVDHAFGGGLVLPLYGRVRGTEDIDVGVFVGVEQRARVFSAMAEVGINVAFSAEDDQKIVSGGWVTAVWSTTAIDVFFADSPLHYESASRIQWTQIGSAEVPILGLEDFVAHKVLFARPIDWEDIDSVLACHPEIDSSVVARWLVAEGRGREVRRRARIYNHLAQLHGAPPIEMPRRLVWPRRQAHAGSRGDQQDHCGDLLNLSATQATTGPLVQRRGVDRLGQPYERWARTRRRTRRSEDE